jgi:hypothetical protein
MHSETHAGVAGMADALHSLKYKSADSKSMINWNRRSYSKEQFIEAWNSSPSIAECARRIGLTIYGSTYTTLRTTAKECNLTEQHMTGQGWNKGIQYKNPNVVRPVVEYLVEHSTYTTTSSLKKRLIKEGLLQEVCAACDKVEVYNPFLDKIVKIPLQLDHSNGKNRDNRIENLRLLCPTCHALTPTFCRKNKGA